MHTRSPLCRSGFTGFSWQFISLSLWLSSGVHTKHIALSSPKPYSLDSLSTSISTLAVFSPLFFYTCCSWLSHSSHTCSFLTLPPLCSLLLSSPVISHHSSHTASTLSARPSPISASPSLFIWSGVTLSIPHEYFSFLHPSLLWSLVSSSPPLHLCCLKVLDPFDFSWQVFGFLSYLQRYTVCVHAAQAGCKLGYEPVFQSR